MDKERIGAETAAALKSIADKHGARGKAPPWAHRALDQLMAEAAHPERGAPQWAHDILDFLWDLFF